MVSDYGSKGSMVVNPMGEEGPVWKGSLTHACIGHHAKKTEQNGIKIHGNQYLMAIMTINVLMDL